MARTLIPLVATTGCLGHFGLWVTRPLYHSVTLTPLWRLNHKRRGLMNQNGCKTWQLSEGTDVFDSWKKQWLPAWSLTRGTTDTWCPSPSCTVGKGSRQPWNFSRNHSLARPRATQRRLDATGRRTSNVDLFCTFSLGCFEMVSGAPQCVSMEKQGGHRPNMARHDHFD